MSTSYLRQLQSDLSAYDISEANSPRDAAAPPSAPPTRPTSADVRSGGDSAAVRERAEAERRLLEKEKSIMELQARLRHAEHSITLSQAQTMQEKTELQQQLHRKQAELHRVKDETQKALSVHQDWSSHLSVLKDSLDDLLIPESLYVEYHAIPRPLQSVQQWVQCRVYELMRVERGHREAVAVECAGLREQLVRAESELERLRMEREQLLRSKRGREAELTDEVRLLDTAKRRLMEEVTTLKLHTDALQVKGGAYDGLQSRLEQVEREHRELSQQSLLHASTVKSLLDEKDALVQRGRDNERKVELLTLDKLYLTTQLDAARDRLTLAERDRDRLQAQADDLRRHKEQMVEQLIRVRDEQKAGYDDRLTAELTRLQERTQADLEAIRGRQKEAYERDIHSLRETRDAVAVELTQLKAVSADSAQAFEQLRLEHAQLTLEVERERGEWRATLQARGFEYERLGLTTEEAMEELRGVKGELEGELRKNRLLRAEYERVQKEVEGMREKVGVYAALERELDLAIVGGGGGQEAKEAVVGEGAVKGIHRILEGVSDSLPLANRRRLQQSILLAQQLAERGRRVVALERELQAKGAEVERLQERVKQVEGWMEGVGQPQGYWVGMLRGKEEEVRGMRERVRQLEGQLGEAERGREEAVRVREEMEADVRRLMSQRTQLTHLRTALQQVRGGGRGDSVGDVGRGMGGGSPGEGVGRLHEQTTVMMGSPEPSRVEWSFASPAPAVRDKRDPELRPVADALPPMWFRKLQQR